MQWQTHPDWLQSSNIPLTIICGPPCSGKTTYVRNNAVAGDVVIDLDLIRRKLRPGFEHWEYDEKLTGRAILLRNRMLAGLAKATTGKAWFIVSAPSQQERDWWQAKLGGKIVLLHPGVSECKRRACTRGTPRAITGIDEWQAKSELPWEG